VSPGLRQLTREVVAAAPGQASGGRRQWPADRAGLPVSEGEAAGQAGPEGGGERWAAAGSEWGGREVGLGWAKNRKWLDKILSNFIGNLDFWQTLEICTRRF
jgi:hypothetical protein